MKVYGKDYQLWTNKKKFQTTNQIMFYITTYSYLYLTLHDHLYQPVCAVDQNSLKWLIGPNKSQQRPNKDRPRGVPGGDVNKNWPFPSPKSMLWRSGFPSAWIVIYGDIPQYLYLYIYVTLCIYSMYQWFGQYNSV
jgi:hypothetical protein